MIFISANIVIYFKITYSFLSILVFLLFLRAINKNENVISH